MDRPVEVGSGSFVIDGEAVLLGVDGISDFNGHALAPA
jgi:ATP-dependent DNA ligase